MIEFFNSHSNWEIKYAKDYRNRASNPVKGKLAAKRQQRSLARAVGPQRPMHFLRPTLQKIEAAVKRIETEQRKFGLGSKNNVLSIISIGTALADIKKLV